VGGRTGFPDFVYTVCPVDTVANNRAATSNGNLFESLDIFIMNAKIIKKRHIIKKKCIFAF
jgi:hypothetical protein